MADMVRTLVPLALTLTFAASYGQSDRLIHQIDFTARQAGNAIPWLQQNGFKFEIGVEDIKPRFANGGLNLSTDKPAKGVINLPFANGSDLRGVKRVRITWGVRHFPEGADWEKGINRVAIGVMISFGTERLPSGLPLGVSAAPYFLSPFLGNKEPHGKIYTGKYWTLGGRYIACRPERVGQAVTTLVEVDELFQQLFKKTPTPPITAVGIQLNSTDTEGRAEAFISRIEFLN